MGEVLSAAQVQYTPEQLAEMEAVDAVPGENCVTAWKDGEE